MTEAGKALAAEMVEHRRKQAERIVDLEDQLAEMTTDRDWQRGEVQRLTLELAEVEGHGAMVL